MTREEFEKKFKELCSDQAVYLPEKLLPYELRTRGASKKNKAEEFSEILGTKVLPQNKVGYYTLPNALVSEHWTVGGATGGNCWGDDANQYVAAEDPPEFPDKVLEQIWPDISMLEYKRLKRVCRPMDYTVHEYYGNFKEKRFLLLTLEDAANALFNG